MNRQILEKFFDAVDTLCPNWRENRIKEYSRYDCTEILRLANRHEMLNQLSKKDLGPFLLFQFRGNQSSFWLGEGTSTLHTRKGWNFFEEYASEIDLTMSKDGEIVAAINPNIRQWMKLCEELNPEIADRAKKLICSAERGERA